MKNFKLFKTLLIAIGLLATSFTTQVWADCTYHVTGGNIYLDATAPNWTQSYIYFAYGHDTYMQLERFSTSTISGTNLYYIGSITSTWASNVCYSMFFQASGNWGADGKSYANISGNSQGYSGTNNYSFNYGTTYLAILGANNDDAPALSNNSSYETLLNHTQTVKKYTYMYDLNAETQSYKNASVNSGTVTISAYKMIAQGEASDEDNSATIDEASEKEVSVDAAYTGEVTLTATPEDGFYFVGWYSSGGTELGTNTSYTYNAPNSTYEVHARFAPCLQKTLYLKSSWPSNNWVSSSALLFAKYMNDSDDPRYVKFNMSSLGGDYYAVTTPAGNWTKVQMLRVNPDKEGDPANGIWNSSNEMPVDGIKNCVTLSNWDNSSSWTLYAPIPCIIGSMNNNCPSAAIMHDGSVDIRLEAHKTYEFKVIDGSSVRGLGNNVWTSSVSNFPTADDGYQIRLCTAGAGDYTFAYNGSDQLSVTYPDVTHPSADYCYLIDYTGGEGSAGSDWSGENTNIHFEHNASNGIAKTTWSGTSIPSGNKARIGSYNYFYYSPGEYPDFNLSKNGSDTHQTGDQSTNWGKYLYYDSSWKWGTFSFSVTLNANGGAIADGHNVTSYNFGTGATLPNGTYVTKAGYTFAGWYDNSGLTGDPVTTITSKDNTTKTYWAKWTPATLYFRAKSTSFWNTDANWYPACVPTIYHDVVIEKPVRVDDEAAQAKSVRILTYGDYTGKVTIEEDAGLVVAEDILAKHTSEGDYEATSKEDLQIRTDNTGNGGLITGSECAHDTAEYVFYTKAYKYGSWYINQYVGIPFVNMYAYQLYGFNIFVYDGTADDWRTPGSTTLEAWKAYNLIRKYTSDDWSYFYLDGILNLPGKSGKKTFTCGWRTSDLGSIDGQDGHQDYLFANSWTAPISIANMTTADCSGASGADLVQTIYIFNAGYVDKTNPQKSVGDLPGQWSSFPIAASSYMSGAVIPATQAFMITSKKGSSGATLTLDYEEHVYNPATSGSGMNTNPTRAPRREQTDDAPNVLKIVVSNDSVNADQLYLFEREDFSYGFDNGWDGHKVPGLSFAPQLYAINGASQMAVNAVPDMNGVGIGFKAGVEASEYTFSFEYADDAEPIYLYDFDTQVYTLISNDATYTFTTSDKDEHARFAITRNNAPQIATDYEQMEAGMVQHAEKFLKNDMLFIRRGGKIYNAEGILVK